MTTSQRTSSSWFGLGCDAVMFGFDAAAVMVLRSLRIAGGGQGATAELIRMVSEKVDAHVAFGAQVLRGRVGADPNALASAMIAHYGPRVRANRRRLAGR